MKPAIPVSALLLTACFVLAGQARAETIDMACNLKSARPLKGSVAPNPQDVDKLVRLAIDTTAKTCDGKPCTIKPKRASWSSDYQQTHLEHRLNRATGQYVSVHSVNGKATSKRIYACKKQ